MSGVNVDCKIGTSNVTGRGIESGLLLSNRARTYLIYEGRCSTHKWVFTGLPCESETDVQSNCCNQCY